MWGTQGCTGKHNGYTGTHNTFLPRSGSGYPFIRGCAGFSPTKNPNNNNNYYYNYYHSYSYSYSYNNYFYNHSQITAHSKGPGAFMRSPAVTWSPPDEQSRTDE